MYHETFEFRRSSAGVRHSDDGSSLDLVGFRLDVTSNLYERFAIAVAAVEEDLAHCDGSRDDDGLS